MQPSYCPFYVSGMKIKTMLGAAVFLALLIGYAELRLPESVIAQGLNAVYRQLSVTSTDSNAVRLAGGLELAGDLTWNGQALDEPNTGTASAITYLRGDGTWAGVSPPTYWTLRYSAATLSTSSNHIC